MVDPTPGKKVQFEGRGREYPLTASVEGMRAGIRFEDALAGWSSRRLRGDEKLGCA